jgi:exodeoxyribonuclease (lambda-induced)
MKIYTELKQGTPEWLQVRLGKFTASNAQAIASNGKGLDTLVYEKAAELLTGQIKEAYTNTDMERGNALEMLARNSYELETGVIITQVGFIEVDEYEGCSPDGLVKEEGLIEIKCKNDSNFVKFLMDGAIDPAHEWQMQHQLKVTGRQWVDYVLFNPNFKKTTVITRVLRNEEKIKKLEAGITTGKAKLTEILKVVNKT